ncbi:unnamed protein product [Candida verbasci]|uniref:Uncharacterized protein n=1 Tax=Candida verbasci TaxID=1227364 RepID=A0A9W4TV81_9ASCO|nr:unnamed protein product [Candida verbasci]
MFKPKYSNKSKTILPLPATFNRISHRRKLAIIIIFIIVIWFINPLSLFNFKSNTLKLYPKAHPLTSNEIIELSSQYLYPPIEDAPLLKQLTPTKLIKFVKGKDSNNPDQDRTKLISLNAFDDPDPIKQKAKEEEENKLSDLDKAKNHFKNQDKVRFKPKSGQVYPEVIIVTTVDFDKYSLDSLTKIVQNRVDYAYRQNYGIYVRWYQEFLPMLNNIEDLKDVEKIKWIRLYCIRAAMFAFPKAKWIWFLDQDGFIMDLNKNLEQYLLNANTLDSIMLREQPLIPPHGLIKTYKNVKSEAIKLILTQSEQKLETNSFLIKNDQVGKSIIEIWSDSLYFNYGSFPYGPDSALTHILQWHPFILSKTTIVPAKQINTSHKSKYEEGDFMVQWSDCNGIECEKIVSIYQDNLDKLKDK